jgi:hypothetical protein
MSIDQSDVIDFLVHDEKNHRAVLLISDAHDWEDEPTHFELLQDKLNHYIWVAESGKLAEEMPELEGLPVLIIVWGMYPLSESARKYYELAGKRVAELGFSLEFDLNGEIFKSMTSD